MDEATKEEMRTNEQAWAMVSFIINEGKHLKLLDPKTFIESTKGSVIKEIHEMSLKELEASQVLVEGFLGSAIEQNADGTYVQLKPRIGSNTGPIINVFAETHKGTELLEYYLNRHVYVVGWPKTASKQGKGGLTEASLAMAYLYEGYPTEIWDEKNRNPLGKPKGKEIQGVLIRKIMAEGKIKVGLMGPEKNGIDLFRREFQKLALENPFLDKCVVWNPIDTPLMPRGYSQPVVDRFYAQLAKKIQAFSESSEDYDVLCLLRGDGSIKDLARLNNISLALPIIRSRIPIVTALGEGNSFLWPSKWADGSVYSPEVLAGILDDLARLAQSQIQSQPKKQTSSSSSAGKSPRKPAIAASTVQSASSISQPAPKAAPKPTAATKPKAKPAASTATKSTKESAAKTTAAASASPQKTPKATKADAPKTARKAAAKPSKTRTTKTPAIAKPAERPKASKTKIIGPILLCILVIIAAVAAFLEKFA